MAGSGRTGDRAAYPHAGGGGAAAAGVHRVAGAVSAGWRTSRPPRGAPMASRRFRIVLGPGAALMVFFALSSTAGAQVTLGTTTQPAGSTPGACFSGATANHVFIQATDDPSVSFTVPAGGGALTTWSTNTTG